MSYLWKPSLYTTKALQTQWINNIFQSHDLFCGCPKPLFHLKEALKEKECRHFTEEEDTTKEIGGIQDGAADTFDEGDLAQLFEAEKEEEKR